MKQKEILHSYSDSDTINNLIAVYPINEIVAEKVRSLMQRNRARDIYDLYFLASAIEPYSFSDIRELLKEKSRHKHLVCCKKGDFISDRKKSYIARAWESSLYNHLPPGKLIEFETAYVKVEKFVEQIITEG